MTTIDSRRTGKAAAPAWRRRDKAWGYVFVGPQVFGMLFFVLLPFLAGLGLAFTQWDGLGEISFVGWSNFGDQLADPLFRKAIVNTLLIALATVPVGLMLAILVATALDRLRRRTFYLILFFLPVVTSSIAVSMIWQQLFRPDGLLSTMLGNLFRITPPDWLNDPHLVLIAVSMVAIWSSLGLNVLIFLAGMANISPAVYEAARVDGAGPVRQFFSIRIPLLSPTIFFSTVIAVISSFQTFDTVFILTKNGGPDQSARTIVYHIYDTGFQHQAFGPSSAAAVLLLVLTLVVTLIQFALQKRFVHYES